MKSASCDSSTVNGVRSGSLHRDRNLRALNLLRARLLSADLSPEMRAAHEALLPDVLWRRSCPACWTCLPAGVEPEFVGCPNCGHGMPAIPVETPFRCVQCGAVSDGTSD